jgi:hypothetical protein
LTTHEIGGGAEDIIPDEKDDFNDQMQSLQCGNCSKYRRSDERALPLVSSRAVD